MPGSESSPRDRLPRRALDYLDGLDGKNDPWGTACTLAIYFRNAGLDEDDFIQAVTESDLSREVASSEDGRPRLDRLRERLQKAWAWSERVWNPPLGDKQSLRAELAALHERIRRHRFTGRSAASDRKVAIWIVEFFHEEGVSSRILAARFVGQHAGVSTATAHRCLARLQEAGLLRLADQSSVTGSATGRSTRYTVNLQWLRDPEQVHTETSSPIPPKGTTC